MKGAEVIPEYFGGHTHQIGHLARSEEDGPGYSPKIGFMDILGQQQIDSQEVGCDGYNHDNTRCPYWVHLCCIGLPDFSRAEFADREFYCDNHNPKIAEIRGMVERNEQNKKGKKKRPQKVRK